MFQQCFSRLPPSPMPFGEGWGGIGGIGGIDADDARPKRGDFRTIHFRTQGGGERRDRRDRRDRSGGKNIGRRGRDGAYCVVANPVPAAPLETQGYAAAVVGALELLPLRAKEIDGACGIPSIYQLSKVVYTAY